MPATTESIAAGPSYGASDHYLGEKGVKYYSSLQDKGGEFKARIDADHFRHLIAPTSVVLDFGCGGGYLLNRLECARRVGVEINPVARTNACRLGIECHAHLGQVTDGVADVVISNHALEHVPFPIGALREIRAKLKPEGTLALCLPVDNWRHQTRYVPNERDHHLHTWTAQLLGNTLVEAGFEPVSIDTWSHAWPGRWTVACYGRLPRPMFDLVCYSYSLISGRGRQLFAVARPSNLTEATPGQTNQPRA